MCYRFRFKFIVAPNVFILHAPHSLANTESFKDMRLNRVIYSLYNTEYNLSVNSKSSHDVSRYREHRTQFWGYFPVLWRLTRISDAIWITMECSCLDIDINLLEKCAGKRIIIDVKVSHFGLNSRKCNISSQPQVPDWPTYFGAGITWHDPKFLIKTITWLRHRTGWNIIWSRLDLDIRLLKLTKLNKNKLSSHKSKSVLIPTSVWFCCRSVACVCLCI